MRDWPARFNALGVSSHAFHADEIASWIKQRGPRGAWNEFTGAHAYVYAITLIHRIIGPTIAAVAAVAVVVTSRRSIIRDLAGEIMEKSQAQPNPSPIESRVASSLPFFLILAWEFNLFRN